MSTQPSDTGNPESGRESAFTTRQYDLAVREFWGNEHADLEAVFQIRDEVFVDEQALTDDARTDPDDKRSFHYLALLDTQPVGTGRLTLYGHEAQVAWVAVRQQYREYGIGKALMLSIIDRCRIESATHIVLNAQTHAESFYARLGFAVVGSEFFMSGIGHKVMIKRLD